MCVGSTLQPDLPHPSFHTERRVGLRLSCRGVTRSRDQDPDRKRGAARTPVPSLLAPLIKPRRNDDPRKCASGGSIVPIEAHRQVHTRPGKFLSFPSLTPLPSFLQKLSSSSSIFARVDPGGGIEKGRKKGRKRKEEKRVALYLEEDGSRHDTKA